MEQVEQLGLPYEEIATDNFANRNIIRDSFKRGRETTYIPFHLIRIRDGFNLRLEYEGIEELAESIASQGLVDPLTVDVLKDGTVYLEQGHRRLKALALLREKSSLPEDVQGIQEGQLIECFINKSTDVNELTRLKRQYSSNQGTPYTVLEISSICERMHLHFGLNSREISEVIGMSRQNVDNMLIIANESDSVKQAIKRGNLSVTAAVALVRKISDQEQRNTFVGNHASAPGDKIRVNDVDKIGSDTNEDEGIKGQLTTATEEEAMCNEVIGSLDKVYTSIKNLNFNEVNPNQFAEAYNQVIMDVEHQIDMSQKKMEKIRDKIKKCSK